MPNTARQTRENRTITIDFQNEATYVQLQPFPLIAMEPLLTCLS
jgi:hypothetical protein